MRKTDPALLLAGVLAAAAPAAAQPLSAIDWLSESVTEAPGLPEEDVTDSAAVEDVTVQPLDAASPDEIGLLPPAMTGLPRELWGPGESAAIRRAIGELPPRALPAITALRRRVLLAEAAPPVDSDGSLLLARIDALLEMGALEEAQALIELADPSTPELFRRWFDVALLTGTEDLPCEALRQSGGFAPTYRARVFCLARNGDWNAAALTLNSADVLDVVTEADYALLSRFLDPELFEGDPPLPVPDRPTPLVFRLYEAIGEPLPTRGLPLAFAHAELRPVAGWKARIEAGERLAREGAIPANRMLGIYTEREPAASGGTWERVEAFQRLDRAVASGDADAVSEHLPRAYEQMGAAGLGRVLAELFAGKLAEMDLSDAAAPYVLKLTLLSDGYESAAGFPGADAGAPEGSGFLRALAAGRPAEAPAPQAPRRKAVRDGFDGAAPPPALQRLLDEGRLGEAILAAARLFGDGAEGDLEQIPRALRLFRSVGLEDTARQAALQLLIMTEPA